MPQVALPTTMRAMRLPQARAPLVCERIDPPRPGPGQVLVRVHACAVCRTDLHVVDGDLSQPKPSVIPGHEIVGAVVASGPGAQPLAPGARVGIPWLGWTCGTCDFCRTGQENLCGAARFTGYTLDGGFAEYCVADARYCFAVPENFDDVSAAPLLCAGLIGFRAYGKAGEGQRVGLYGFGAAAHILAQIAVHDGREVYAFTKPGDGAGQDFARGLGCRWAGGSDQPPPEPLDAAIIFAPVGALVPAALRQVRKGGTVVCAGIHMSDIPGFPYELLWSERSILSVANLTRADGDAFFKAVARVPLRIATKTYPLESANAALDDLRQGRVEGAAVLVPGRA